MPLFLASLLGGLAAAMGSLVGRVLVALGIGFVSFTGFSTVLSWGQSQWQAGLGGLSADMAAMAADEKTQEWWKVCSPMQAPFETRKPGEWWAAMEEVFHTE